jgi:hypothetical protein
MSDDSNPEDNDDELSRPGGSGGDDHSAQAPDPGDEGRTKSLGEWRNSYEELAGHSALDASEIARIVNEAKLKLERDDALYSSVVRPAAAGRVTIAHPYNPRNPYGGGPAHLISSGFSVYSSIPPQFGGSMVSSSVALLIGPSPRPKLPKEIIASEITAWRVWKWDGSRLCSTAVDVIWEPGETMRGEPQHGYGVHCWKTREQALQYGASMVGVGDCRYVLGTVSVWGKSVRCEFGRRVSHAEITDIVGFVGKPRLGDASRLEKIRRTYHVPFDPRFDAVDPPVHDSADLTGHPSVHDPTGPHVHIRPRQSVPWLAWLGRGFTWYRDYPT